MTKPFNIHDWQAKQAKQRLTENDDAYQKRQDDMTPGKNPDYFYDDNFKKLKQKYSGASQESMSNADIKFLQDLVQKYSLDKILVTLGAVGDRALPTRGEDMNESLNPEVSRSLDKFIRAMADRYDYTMQDAVYAIMAALKQRNYDGLGEHHGDDFPKGLLDKKVSSFLDDLKKKSETDYDAIEDIMKKHFSIDETNSLGSAGAGASFQAGNSDAYATPKAFGDDKKKKMKAYKSIGYKKV
ncbi:hypothetical protein N9Z72_00255 [Akkermansiaceae bacterium]|nr:hypothetical protein [Akkermansiaceae bacterium]